ncbi:hypothetical protein U875_19060 [Pandoraea pnomenusa 3kgm]|nr:hypothetical protein U875_19060 [Pandoraea pnomenusa 3kgm]
MCALFLNPGVAVETNLANVENVVLFARLYEAHGRRIYRFILRHIGNHGDAEDITQQVFLDASRCHDSFRGESEYSTWLYGIALNQIKNYLNRSPGRRYSFEEYNSLEDTHTSNNDVEGIAVQNELFNIIATQINNLPNDMRDILMAVGLKEMSYEEAGALLGIPIGTVRSRLSRARALLRERMRACGAGLDE